MIQYTLAITPSPEISKSVTSFYKDFSIYRHTTLPPHLTLLPPFTITDLSHEKFLYIVISCVSNTPPFEIIFDKVGNFRGRNNIIHLSTSTKSTEKIRNLVEKLSTALESHIEIQGVIPAKAGIHPINTKDHFQSHLSLAKHVPDKEFNSVNFEAKKRFSPVSFICSGFSFFKNEGQGWKKVTDIKF